MENFTENMKTAIYFAKECTKSAKANFVNVEAVALGIIMLSDTPIRSAFTHYEVDIEELASELHRKLESRSKDNPSTSLSPASHLFLTLLGTQDNLTLSKMFVDLVDSFGYINDALLRSCNEPSKCSTMIQSLRQEAAKPRPTAMERYVKNAIKTESLIGDITLEDGRKISSRIMHGIDGCVTEAGELQDAMKRHMFYGKELDLVNLKEEVGDIMWYLAILVDELGTSFEELGDINIKKLSSRYPEKFSSEKALNRDLDKERDILEQKQILEQKAEDVERMIHNPKRFVRPERLVRPEPVFYKDGELPEPPIKPEKRVIKEDVTPGDIVEVFGLFLDLMKEAKGIAKDKIFPTPPTPPKPRETKTGGRNES